MLDAHQASLTPEELPLFVVEDDELAATLARVGKAMSDRKERKSAKQTESQSKPTRSPR